MQFLAKLNTLCCAEREVCAKEIIVANLETCGVSLYCLKRVMNLHFVKVLILKRVMSVQCTQY